MQVRYALWLCAALIPLQSSAGAQSDVQIAQAATVRAVQKVELEWLEREIGRFASGRLAVFAGEMKVTQRDRDGVIVVEGSTLATLSPAAPQTLTILFPDLERWLRLTQDPDKPDATTVTRLRALNANAGVSATCVDCIAPDLAGEVLLLRLAAEGELLDAARSRFGIELSGHLQRIAPKTLRLNQILSLSLDIAAWQRRPDVPFQTRGGEAVRDVTAVLRQPAPAPGGDTARYTCAYETPYTAQHYVDLNDLTRFGVRDVTLGGPRLCCVDHALHDGAKMCTEEGAQ